MLIALCGVSGVGKSFFSTILPTKISGLKKLKTIRIRKPRNQNETKDENSIFMTVEELENATKEGKIGLQFEIYNSKYAYLKEELYGEDNYIFEMHYSKIDQCRKLFDNIKIIYIFPKDLETAIEKIKERNLEKEIEEDRIEEAREQYELFRKNIDLASNFDFVLTNNYDEKSIDKVENTVKMFLNGSENIGRKIGGIMEKIN